MKQNLSKLVDTLSSLTILEAAELAKLLEDKWGVSAAVAMAPQQGNAQQSDAAEKVVEKTEVDILLTEVGPTKLNVVKEVRAITGLGLIEAKKLVESTLPVAIQKEVKKEEANDIKSKLEAAGAKVEIK